MDDLRPYPCDQCGRLVNSFECAETIEEWLCEWCASGITDDPDEEWMDDGFSDGFDN